MQPISNFRLLRFTPPVTGLPFKVTTIEALEEEPDGRNKQPHRNGYYEIRWIVGGAGTYWIDLDQHDIEDNKVIFIKPGQAFKTNYSRGTEGFVILFTESFLNIVELHFDQPGQTSLLDLFTNSTGILLKAEMLTEMRDIVNKMIKEYQNICLFKNEILNHYLRIFFLLLIRQHQKGCNAMVQPRMCDLVDNFMKLLDSDFKEKKMVSDYASQLFVTPNYLNEVIKNKTGYSAGYHIRRRIVLEAKRMALHSHISMKEIAYNLGFLDPAHFSKFFKSINGVNFSDFKKEKISVRRAV